jgi:hypothetical protein
VENVNWTKGIHASAPERECDMMPPEDIGDAD